VRQGIGRLLRAAGLLLAAGLAGPALAADPVEVDTELVLLVDVSRSMSPHELEIQRRGYAEALTSPQVISAIRGGLLGRVAVTYVEWAGAGNQRVVVDWRLLESRADAEAFAHTLTSYFNPALRRTSISSALHFARHALDTNGFHGLRRVIDVSGDGPNNAGERVDHARDAVLAAGIVINGLPLMTRDGLGSEWDLEDLDRYYLACVTGGPGSFVIPVRHWDDFAAAVRRKLVLELASTAPVPAQYAPRPDYDCLVGEKIWERNRNRWVP
jgi:hypothetical protein